MLKSIRRFKSPFTQQNVISQHYYQPYCNCLLNLGHMDEEQAVFGQFTLSDLRCGVPQH